MALGLLSLIEAFDPCIVSDREVGRFDNAQAKILIAVLGIAAAFLLAVALTSGSPHSDSTRRSLPPWEIS